MTGYKIWKGDGLVRERINVFINPTRAMIILKVGGNLSHTPRSDPV